MKYVVTITKEGSMEIEAETEEAARAIAEEMESEGSFWMSGVEINVEKVE